ncbi:MAG: hypothetical protein R3E91_00550 [Chlamydiales bacterium]
MSILVNFEQSKSQPLEAWKPTMIYPSTNRKVGGLVALISAVFIAIVATVAATGIFGGGVVYFIAAGGIVFGTIPLLSLATYLVYPKFVRKSMFENTTPNDLVETAQ